ncbi:hypothetical protein [Anaeromyxobacter sp. PSR-1]|uniref:hypothetical protein n=1 Tax=Anaeromyxobacter sp. PSR-1 TaxID=1300915 RepID=UPI001ED9A02E|nr:hypothetical protein [Anaeromyxobacter sp. PSR-1]
MLDLFFRKYAWTANLALLFAAAWLTAKTVNTLVGAVIRPRPQAELALPPPAPARTVLPASIDEARLYHLIGQEPPQQSADATPAAPARPQNCADPRAEPARSDLRLALVAGVVAEQPRFSLATITDLTTRETVVLGVGDRIQGAQLLGLQRVRDGGDVTGNAFKVIAVLCNRGTKEYLDFEGGGSEAPDAGTNLGYSSVPRPSPRRARRGRWRACARSRRTSTRSTARSSTARSTT